MQACARICIEVDLGKGLPEAIKLKVDNWTHIQQLDYEQIPFKCKVCHEYNHFANRCSKFIYIENPDLDTQWETIKRKKTTSNLVSTGNRSAHSAPPLKDPSSIPSPSSQQPSDPSQQPYDLSLIPPSIPSLASSNPFSSLTLSEK